MLIKKLTAWVLSFVMAMTLVPAIQYTAFATDDGEISDIELILTQPSIQITEGTNISQQVYTDEENEEEMQYFKYSFPPIRNYLKGLTVTYTSGNQADYIWDKNLDAFTSEGRVNIDFDDLEFVGDNQRLEPWQAGSSYDLIAYYKGIEVKVPITIVKRSIADIQIGLKNSPIEILENPINESGTRDRYPMPFLDKYLTDIMITDTNGETTVYAWNKSKSRFEAANGDNIDFAYFFNSVSSDQDTNPWNAGEEHAFVVTYLGKTAEIPVRIVEDNISEIKLNLNPVRIPISEFTNGKKAYRVISGESHGDTEEYYSYFLPNLTDKLRGLTIIYNDGTQKQYAWDKDSQKFTCDGEYDIPYFELFDYYTSNQAKTPWHAGESHSFTAYYNEIKIDVPVKINHVYVHKRVEPQIGIAGKTYDKCSKCGKIINSKTIAALKPAKTSIKTLRRGKKSFTVSWYKKSYTGYQIRYSTKSGMTSPKTVTVTSSATTSKTVKSLKARKKYYVQVRTYKTVKGNRVYSTWSTKKSVTTK